MAWVRILAQKDWPKSRYASKINRKEEAAGEREREREKAGHTQRGNRRGISTGAVELTKGSKDSLSP